MIIQIKSEEQAEKILKSLNPELLIVNNLIFDIDESIKIWQEIPLCFRKCKDCKTEYIGFDTIGIINPPISVYCPKCGCGYDYDITVDLAIQGKKVLYTKWRIKSY